MTFRTLLLRPRARRWAWQLALLALGLAVGCASAADSTVQQEPRRTPAPAREPVDANRAIAEADIIQLDSGRLYAMSKLGMVSVVDVSTPGELTLLGQTALPGEPFEMYRREGLLFAMSNVDRFAAVFVLDVQDPTSIRTLARLDVTGEIADSRIVGNILYLATYENARCDGCWPAPRTLVTSYDISDPAAVHRVEQVWFDSNAPADATLAWGRNWKRSILLTDGRMYIGGHAELDSQSGTLEGIIDVLDVSDPLGRLRPGARIRVAGAILSRWQLDEHNGVLRVVSQKDAGQTANGIGAPEVDTFRVDGAQSVTPLGHMTMSLPRQEGLRTVRFDGARAYAITYNQADPLFVIDLSDPEHPEQRGELHLPGFMFHLEPRGDRVIGLGIDPSDLKGSLNVSLFDASNPDEPRMLERVAFATPGVTEEYEILNEEVSEDQDRIQKSFRALPDGLVVVPFAALRRYGVQDASCDNVGGGVQLVEWRGDTLRKRALLPLPGHPRRAFEHEQEMIAVSDSTVRAFALSDLDRAQQTADLTIGTCVPDEPAYPDYGSSERDDYSAACSVLAAHGGEAGWPCLLGLAVVALLLRNSTRRRARMIR